MPADTAWPPAGVRDLKPDIPVNNMADHVRFPTLRDALEREVLKQAAPTAQVSFDALTRQRVPGLEHEAPDTLSQLRVLDMLRRTRSRTIEYLCRAYLQFGRSAMSSRDLKILCAAINAAPRLKKQTP